MCEKDLLCSTRIVVYVTCTVPPRAMAAVATRKGRVDGHTIYYSGCQTDCPASFRKGDPSVKKVIGKFACRAYGSCPCKGLGQCVSLRR